MEKILSVLAEFKNYFTGIQASLDKVTAAEVQVKTLETERLTLSASITERDEKIASLTTDLEKIQNEVNSKGSEIKALSEALDTEKRRANETIASQGLPLDQVPPSAPSAPSGQPAKPESKGLARTQAAFAAELAKSRK